MNTKHLIKYQQHITKLIKPFLKHQQNFYKIQHVTRISHLDEIIRILLDSKQHHRPRRLTGAHHRRRQNPEVPESGLQSRVPPINNRLSQSTMLISSKTKHIFRNQTRPEVSSSKISPYIQLYIHTSKHQEDGDEKKLKSSLTFKREQQFISSEKRNKRDRVWRVLLATQKKRMGGGGLI